MVNYHMCFEYFNNSNNRKNISKTNSQIEKLNNSTFVILIFEISKFRNIGHSTFRRSKFWPPTWKLPNTWACQQHKYLKHGVREPVASEKITLGQVVPNFTEQVVSSKILRIFTWKLWVTLRSVQLSKWPWHKKTCINKLTLWSGTLMFRLKEKISVFRNFFDQWNFYRRLYFLTLRYGESCHRWLSLIKWSLKTIVLRFLKNPILFNCSSLKTSTYHIFPKYWTQKVQKSWKKICDNKPRSTLLFLRWFYLMENRQSSTRMWVEPSET